MYLGGIKPHLVRDELAMVLRWDKRLATGIHRVYDSPSSCSKIGNTKN